MKPFKINNWVRNEPSNAIFQIKEVPNKHHLKSREGTLFMTKNCVAWIPEPHTFAWHKEKGFLEIIGTKKINEELFVSFKEFFNPLNSVETVKFKEIQIEPFFGQKPSFEF